MTAVYKAALAAFVVLLLLSVHAQFVAGDASPDKALTLYTAGAWLSGKALYSQLFTVQPPFIYYLYSLPVYAARLLGGIADYTMLTAFVLLAIAVVTACALRMIRFHPAFRSDCRQQMEFCALLLFVFILFQNPIFFADREHIFLILVFPYLLRWMPSVAQAPLPWHWRVVTGLLAACGFCIKPHCLVVLVGINLAGMIMQRSWRILYSIENIIIYAALGTYAVIVWRFYPEYVQLVLPMALATYSGASGGKRITFYVVKALLILGITFADFRMRHSSPYRRDIYYLLAVSVSVLGYVLANNGWGYTWNLLHSILLIVTGFVLWEYRHLKREAQASGVPHKPFEFGLRACRVNFMWNAALSVLVLYGFCFQTCGRYFADCAEGKQTLQEIRAANGGAQLTSFGSISIDFGTWAYLSRTTGAGWDTRFNHLWMLPKMLAADAKFVAAHQWVLDDVESGLAEDMDHYKPQLMFVDDGGTLYSYHGNVDLLAYLSASPRFAQAWRHYRYAGKMAPLYPSDSGKGGGFLIYKRID